MVKYKQRHIDKLVQENFKDLDPMQRDLLASRIKLEDEAHFCNGDKDLEGMLKDSRLIEGARLLKKHLDAGSSILVITDGDCDGVSCAAVANLYFRTEHNLYPSEVDESTANKGPEFEPTITPYEQEGMPKGSLKITVNDRKFGNGVNLVHAKDILKQKPDLIITADHGSADHKSFELLKDVLPHTDILVTDHHVIPDNVLPKHDAFVNPQEPGSNLGSSLCGAAVLYMLFRACAGKELEYLYPIVGLATVVDQMDLGLGYNRYLYRQANKYLKGFKPFRNYVKWMEHRYLWSTEFYSIGLGPLINSTKRMDRPDIAYRFLSSETDTDIFKYYKEMMGTNKDRKVQQGKVEESIVASVNKDREHYTKSRVAITDIRNGVNGILASRLVDSDHVPSFVFHRVGDTISGSGRGYGDFDIEGLITRFRKEYKSVYISGGGHKGAGGLRMKADGAYLFRSLFERMAENVDGDAHEWFDKSLPLSVIDSKDVRKGLRRLQPFGRGFPYPVFETMVTILGFKNYGPSFYIYKVSNSNKVYTMMRFSELLGVELNTPTSIYVSPRGKKDFILLDKK